MIKRKNKMLVGILSFLLVITVGYALFSEELKINGMASAQGNLDLSYECVGEPIKNGPADGSCSVDDEHSTVMTTSTMSKPSDWVEFVIRITNTGSIPAVLSEVDSPNNVLFYNTTAAGDEMYFDETTFFSGSYIITNEVGSDGSIMGDFVFGDEAVKNAKITLQPGESVYLLIHHTWENLDNQPVLPENSVGMNYDLTFDFVQETAS